MSAGDRARGALPYGLVSLWDMINFSPSWFNSLLDALSRIERHARERDLRAREVGDTGGGDHYWADEGELTEAKVYARALGNAFNQMYSGVTLTRFKRFESRCSLPSCSWADLAAQITALIEAVESELRQHHFFHYDPAKAALVLSFKERWGDIVSAFQCESDSLSAVDCYALGHNTASVFHSMRVAEFGLRALAKERKITLAKGKPVEWGTWQEIINALEAEAKAIGSTRPAGRAKDRALAFYSGAVSDLNGFKDEYRNLVMHLRKDYDEHLARRALEQVHSFMSRLVAAKLSHKNFRIRWGFR